MALIYSLLYKTCGVPCCWNQRPSRYQINSKEKTRTVLVPSELWYTLENGKQFPRERRPHRSTSCSSTRRQILFPSRAEHGVPVSPFVTAFQTWEYSPTQKAETVPKALEAGLDVEVCFSRSANRLLAEQRRRFKVILTLLAETKLHRRAVACSHSTSLQAGFLDVGEHPGAAAFFTGPQSTDAL